MKIAVLALGTLAADPAPRLDGPLLPLEFARTSPKGGFILVLCRWQWGLDIQTPWVQSTLDDLQRACEELRRRENIPLDEVGYVKRDPNSEVPEHFVQARDEALKNIVRGRLRPWLHANQFDVVIWRDSVANAPFLYAATLEAAKAQAVEFLLQGNDAETVKKYYRRVSIQVWTSIRASIADHRGWMPEPTDARITTADDLRFKDWQECRTTTGRLDTILEDLRKVGFSIITGLLTASAFLNFLGVTTTPGVPAPSTDVRAAVFIAVMVLVAALFSVDTYYEVLLSGAVERALDLEAQMEPPIRVTKYLSVNATRSGISYIILALYLVLLATAEGLGLFAARGTNLVLAWPTGIWLGVSITGFVILVLGVGVMIVAYGKSQPTPPDTSLPWFAGVLLFVTVGLETFLLSHEVTAPLDVWHWITATGMFLAIYMQFYWVYSAWRSGLYRQKPGRNWPEGREKIPNPFGPDSLQS